MVFSIFLGDVNQSKLLADAASFHDIALVLIPCHLLLLSTCLLVAWKTFALDWNFPLSLKFYWRLWKWKISLPYLKNGNSVAKQKIKMKNQFMFYSLLWNGRFEDFQTLFENRNSVDCFTWCFDNGKCSVLFQYFCSCVVICVDKQNYLNIVWEFYVPISIFVGNSARAGNNLSLVTVTRTLFCCHYQHTSFSCSYALLFFC